MSEENNRNSAECAPSDCASCGSNCASNPNNPNTITLTMEDDTEVTCAILTIYPVEEKEYIALLPLDEDGDNKSGEVFLYAFSRTEDGDPILANIDDDDEYVAAAEAFDTILENARKAEEAGEPLE